MAVFLIVVSFCYKSSCHLRIFSRDYGYKFQLKKSLLMTLGKGDVRHSSR